MQQPQTGRAFRKFHRNKQEVAGSLAVKILQQMDLWQSKVPVSAQLFFLDFARPGPLPGRIYTVIYFVLLF